jgi:rhamnulokinase
MGVEVGQASLTDQTLELNMTNEGGVDGTYRLLKNIMGLWLVQQCKRSFERRGLNYSYGEMEEMAAKAPALRSLVDVNDTRFLNPPDMPAAIQAYCQDTGQPIPRTEGELVRCALEGLALKYREVLRNLEGLTGGHIEVIHIVGGGSKNNTLNQFAADACQRTVKAGPVEATAMGNLLAQVRASGELGSLHEARTLLRKTTEMRSFEPRSGAAWEEAAARLAELKKK